MARRADAEAIWSREGCYSFVQAYNRVNQYAQWYLSRGVKPHDIVAFYLHNSPDFIFAWLGLFAVGAAPAMINYNLAGTALLHCVKVPGAKLLMADDDPEFVTRINGVREILEQEHGMKIVFMDSSIKAEICNQKAERVDDAYRKVVKGNSPMCLFYTRFVVSQTDDVLSNRCPAAQLACQKPVLFNTNEHFQNRRR